MVDPLPAKRMYILFRPDEKPPVTVSNDLESCYNGFGHRMPRTVRHESVRHESVRIVDDFSDLF